MTYNKAEIMKRAWQNYNGLMFKSYTTFAADDSTFSNPISVTITFGDMLKKAWDEAKEQVAHERKQAAIAHALASDTQTQAEIAKIDNEIFYLNMKDLWNSNDREYNRKLEAQRQAILDGIAANVA